MVEWLHRTTAGTATGPQVETVITGPPVDPVDRFRGLPLPAWERRGDYRDIRYERGRGHRQDHHLPARGPQRLPAPDPLRAEPTPSTRPGTTRRSAWSSSPARVPTPSARAATRRIRGDDGYLGDDDVARQGIGRLNVLDLQIQIRRLPKPVVAMVAGYAIGGGHVLHLVCDLTIAADNARFGQTGPKVGSFDGGYGPSLLARTIGLKRAKEIWFLCRQYDAGHGARLGPGQHGGARWPTSRPRRWPGAGRCWRCRRIALRMLKGGLQRRRRRPGRAPAARRRRHHALLHDRGGPGGPQRLPGAPPARLRPLPPAPVTGPGEPAPGPGPAAVAARRRPRTLPAAVAGGCSAPGPAPWPPRAGAGGGAAPPPAWSAATGRRPPAVDLVAGGLAPWSWPWPSRSAPTTPTTTRTGSGAPTTSGWARCGWWPRAWPRRRRSSGPPSWRFGVAGVAGLALAAATSWWILLVGAACLLAGWFYTGGPRPYGYAGLGEVFVFVFFGLVATVGHGLRPDRSTSAAGWCGWPPSPVGLLATALLVANNLRDIADRPRDRQADPGRPARPPRRRLVLRGLCRAARSLAVAGLGGRWPSPVPSTCPGRAAAPPAAGRCRWPSPRSGSCWATPRAGRCCRCWRRPAGCSWRSACCWPWRCGATVPPALAPVHRSGRGRRSGPPPQERPGRRGTAAPAAATSAGCCRCGAWPAPGTTAWVASGRWPGQPGAAQRGELASSGSR